jgi:hypothetical protein
MSRHFIIATVLTFGLLVGGVPGEETDKALQFARETLAFVERSAPRPKLAAALAALEKQHAEARKDHDAAGEELQKEARRLRRAIILSHPALDFDRLLINKRPPPAYSHQSRQYLGRYSLPGPGLVVLESWKDEPKETVLLQGKLPVGSVLHPDLSFDAKQVLFSFCDHSEPDPNLRRFFIYEIGVDGSRLRQLTGTEDDPLAGADGRQTALIEDYDPCYLPDGGLAFVSTRLQAHVRCQYGGRYFANFVLYRADADGSNIRRLSFGEAPEWEPSMLEDGRIIYTRWDYVNRHDTLFQSLWVTRPDGTAVAHVYGNYTRNPCTTAEPRAVPGSHKIVTTAVAHHGYTAGSIIVVDPRESQEGETPITRITPEIQFPETEGWPVGAYANPYPFSEDLFLVACTPDTLVREGKVQRASAYGIYLIDTLGGRELIYRDPNMSCFSPIPIRPRPAPPVLPSAVEKGEATGVFYVNNVYQSTQVIPSGSIKSLRVVRLFEQTVETPPSRGKAIIDMPKRILGSVPVGEDGSAAFRAPAGKPLLFQLLDENDMAVMSMRTLVYLQPGEVVGCVGCHEPRDRATRPVALPGGVTIHDLKPPAGPRYEGGLSFARTVQPVLDRYCIGCHGLDKTEGDVDLLGTLKHVTFPYPTWPGPNKMIVSHAYESLMNRPELVAIAQRNFETDFSTPRDYFAHAGTLAGMLLAGHPDAEGKARVTLDRESFQRIVDWLDTNAMFYGDYSWNKVEWRKPSPGGEKVLREHIRETFGEELAGQPFAALVNVAQPSESRILKAALSTAAGGWRQNETDGWRDTTHPGYRKMRQLVHAAIAPLEFHDIADTCARDKCLCDTCWVRQDREHRRNPDAR